VGGAVCGAPPSLVAIRRCSASELKRRLASAGAHYFWKPGRRRSNRTLPVPTPLEAEEVASFLAHLPGRIELSDRAHVTGAMLRDLYEVWFLTGWRSNEIVALRLDWLISPRGAYTSAPYGCPGAGTRPRPRPGSIAVTAGASRASCEAEVSAKCPRNARDEESRVVLRQGKWRRGESNL
jgi:hypothetical protein